jgi:hypothetical protein
MDESTAIAADPREEIARLEDRIEQLAARIESCRKFIAASRLAISLGGILLAAMILQLILFDPLAMSAAIVAVLGGIVLSGSNRSTALEAEAQMAQAEAARAALIGRIDLQVVGGRDTLH